MTKDPILKKIFPEQAMLAFKQPPLIPQTNISIYE